MKMPEEPQLPASATNSASLAFAFLHRVGQTFLLKPRHSGPDNAKVAKASPAFSKVRLVLSGVNYRVVVKIASILPQ